VWPVRRAKATWDAEYGDAVMRQGRRERRPHPALALQAGRGEWDLDKWAALEPAWNCGPAFRAGAFVALDQGPDESAAVIAPPCPGGEEPPGARPADRPDSAAAVDAKACRVSD